MGIPTLKEMYGAGAGYLGRLPIFGAQATANEDGPLNYGYWQGIDWNNGPITPSQRKLASDNLIRLVVDHLNIENHHEILEVGHGTGYGARLVLQEYNPHKINAMDQSPDQVSRAKNARTTPDQKARIDFRQGAAEQLDFPDSQFDGIYSVEAAQHFTSFQQFAMEAYRTIRAGGRFSLCAFWMSRPDSLEELKQILPTIASGADNPIYIGEATSHLKNAGFQQVETEAIGYAVWYPLVAYCEQVLPDQKWSRNWITGYESGLINYYLIYGQK